MPFDAEITEKSRVLIDLEQARALLAHGWCQHVASDGDNYCIIGALRAVQPECLKVALALRALGFFIGHPDFPGYIEYTHVQWNDQPGRTQAQVLARFDAAIAKLSHDG